MVTLLAPVAKAPTYVKVANFPGLYRHSRSGRDYACKKLNGIRRERSLGTCDRKIAERKLKEWIGNLGTDLVRLGIPTNIGGRYLRVVLKQAVLISEKFVAARVSRPCPVDKREFAPLNRPATNAFR